MEKYSELNNYENTIFQNSRYIATEVFRRKLIVLNTSFGKEEKLNELNKSTSVKIRITE